MNKNKNLIANIQMMHHKFGVHEVVNEMVINGEWDKLRDYLAFRLDMVEEEMTETVTAFAKRDAEGVVDGLIDIIVFALGTLDVMAVDMNEAWEQVHEANMNKEKGIKPERPNPYGFPDMIKPEGWVEPSHKGNTGNLLDILRK